MPDFKSQFPRWEPPSIDLILPRTLSDHGKDLFKVSLTWTNTTTCNKYLAGIMHSKKPYNYVIHELLFNVTLILKL